MSGVFLTGTDTGCGKTSVGVALARALVAAGLRPRVLKPVETGCEERSGARWPADARALAEAAGDDAPLERLCPYRLSLPAAPVVAARHESLEIEPMRLTKAYREAAATGDPVLVEGAGGLLVPIARGYDMADLARELELPLLVAVRAALGTINHTRLTLEAAAARGLRVVGVAVSHTEPDLSAADRANLDCLLAELPVACLGELRYGAQAIEPALDVPAFLSTLDA